MTPLRKRMITDMQLRRFSKHTQRAYLSSVTGLAEYYKKSPDRISPDEFRDYVLFLTNERRLSYNSINTITAGIRFFYSEIIDRKEMSLAIPRLKRPKNLPEVFSRDELVLLFSSIENKKHRTLLVTTYSCGLRVSEVIRLKVADIDSNRMTVKVSQSKGARDRYTILSPLLLAELRSYWLVHQPRFWLFENKRTRGRLSRKTAHKIFTEAKNRAKITKKVTFHGLRHYVECYIMVSEEAFV